MSGSGGRAVCAMPGVFTDEEAIGNWWFTDESGISRIIVLTDRSLAEDESMIGLLADKLGMIDQGENLRLAIQTAHDMRLRVVEDPDANESRVYSWQSGMAHFSDIKLSRYCPIRNNVLVMRSLETGRLVTQECNVSMTKFEK